MNMRRKIGVDGENSQSITSWHIILLSSQRMANYKAPYTATSFYHHHSETNKNLLSVIGIKT